MDILNMYQTKLSTAEEAVRFVQPGEAIVFPINPGEPPALLEALPSNDKLHGNTIYRMIPGYPVLKMEPEKIKQISVFLGGQDRRAYSEGIVDLLPNHFSETFLL